MFRFRPLPIVLGLLLLTFTVRLGDFTVQLLRGEKAELQPSIALAEESGEESGGHDEKPKEGEKKDEKSPAAAREEIPAKKGVKEATIQGDEPDPFIQEYSDEEIKVLESLSKRREQIEQRERDLDQREKLLQAAEKKVDEKVAELTKLQKNIEDLLNKQTEMQDQRIAQLVKIYENMKPKDAANIFNDMDFDVLLEIVDKMSERKVAPILAAMDPVRAREISARIAEQKALPKKQEKTP